MLHVIRIPQGFYNDGGLKTATWTRVTLGVGLFSPGDLKFTLDFDLLP